MIGPMFQTSPDEESAFLDVEEFLHDDGNLLMITPYAINAEGERVPWDSWEGTKKQVAALAAWLTEWAATPEEPTA